MNRAGHLLHLDEEEEINKYLEVQMEIRFADGTQIEVAASALDDFVRHDLKWAEYVHGTAAMKSPADPTVKFAPQRAKQIAKNIMRCPSAQGC
jgi:hypothetical protein